MNLFGMFRFSVLRARLASAFSGPAILAFVPALCLGAFWLGGEVALIVVSLGVPLLIVLVNPQALNAKTQTMQKMRGLVPREDFPELLSDVFLKARKNGRLSAVFLIELSDFPELIEHHGQAAAEKVAQRVGERLEGVMRETDSGSHLSSSRFGICLAPVQHLDLEACIELAGRLQNAIEEPVSVDGIAVYVSAAIGFCQSNRAPGADGEAWFNAASIALNDACTRGPTTIRAFSLEMHKTVTARMNLREEARDALENGQVQPWYQPQISTDTGRVTGFEALARWSHPERGLISPAEFLPAFEEMGLLDRLGEVMLYHTLTALKAWDATGVNVPKVGVNFSGAELNNPRLVDRVQWELDRFDIAPERLAVEILETVVSSSPGDTVARNVNSLGTLGCKIDLDDFGTGNASIAAIRRFNVSRIKIDRSFVIKACLLYTSPSPRD